MKTNTSYFYHYNILGLQPGASQEEVHSAYRRLVKLYHPDQDSSLDAEMKYKEISAAYNALKQKAKFQPQTASPTTEHSPPPAPPKEHVNTNYYETVHGKGWDYVETEGTYEYEFDFGDLMDEYDKGTRPSKAKKRLPLSLENLPDIFRISFNEAFCFLTVIRALFVIPAFWAMLAWVGWGIAWRAGTILLLFPAMLLYRYYLSYEYHVHTPSFNFRIPISNILGSLLFAVALSYICTATTDQTSVEILHVSRYRAHRYESDVFSHLILRTYLSLYLLWGSNNFVSLSLIVSLLPMLIPILFQS